MVADPSSGPDTDIRARKAALRQRLIAARAALPDAERTAAAAALARQASDICAMARKAMPFTLSGFVALRGEIDPFPLLAALAARGVRLALPRVRGGDVDFHGYTPGDVLVRGRFGLSEPAADAPRITPDVVLVPLLAFDRAGQRLGYGKGFYDRALAALPGALAIGVAFAMQQVAAVPVESHDRGLDFVLTERGLIDYRPARGQ